MKQNDKIYLIKCDVNGIITYKIGKTTRNVKERINEMQTGNSGTFSIIHIFKTKNASKLESVLHNAYRNIKIKGEWFSDKLDENKFKDDCIFFNNLILTLQNFDNPFI